MNPMKPPLKHCIHCDKRQMNHKYSNCWNEGKCHDCYLNGPLPQFTDEISPGSARMNPVDLYWDILATRMAHRGETY